MIKIYDPNETPGLAKIHLNRTKDFVLKRIQFVKSFFIYLKDHLDNGALLDLSALYRSFDINGNEKNHLINKLLFNSLGASNRPSLNCDNLQAELSNNVLTKLKQVYKDPNIHIRNFQLIERDIEEILIGLPDKLEDLYSDIIQPYYQDCERQSPQSKDKLDAFFQSIFNYSRFSSKDKGIPFGRRKSYTHYDLANLLNINTCPYCNRIFTFTVNDPRSNEGIIAPQFDHFLDQGTKPIFGISFYNLIPCCNYCNSVLKRDNSFSYRSHVHPYFEEFGTSGVFDYLIKSVDGSFGEINDNKVIIVCNSNGPLADKIINSKEVFRLEEIYNAHSDYLAEILLEHQRYSRRYLKILALETFQNLGLGLEESYRLAYSNYYEERNFQKRPLAKFTKDIFSKLQQVMIS